jgi:hypothetical protein
MRGLEERGAAPVAEATTARPVPLRRGHSGRYKFFATAGGLMLCTVANHFGPRFRSNRWRSKDRRYETLLAPTASGAVRRNALTSKPGLSLNRILMAL